MGTQTDRRSHRAGTFAVLGLVLATALLTLCRHESPADVAPSDSTRPANPPRPTASPTSAPGERHAPSDASDAQSGREAVPLPPTTSEAWCVQLVGVDPAVPWSSTLVLEFERRHVVQAAVDAQGACRFEPPAAVREPGIQMLRFVADDANYRLERSHGRTDELQTNGRMELRVHPTAVLRGRVLGPDGEGIEARVRAFRWNGEAPAEPLCGLATSDATGHYQLQAPPGVPLLLVADVVDTGVMAQRSDQGALQLVLPGQRQLERSIPTSELHMHGQGPSRQDLLPAIVHAQGRHGTPCDAPDLRLGRMATLTGRVLFADGRPLVLVDVVATPRSSAAAFHQGLRWSSTLGVISGTNTRTDSKGAFAMWLAPGVPYDVIATSSEPLLLAGEPAATVSAPGHVELTAPGDLVRVVVAEDAKPVGGATVDVGGMQLQTDTSGELLLTLPHDDVRLRAWADVRASSWLELPPGPRPDTVTLELRTPTLADVRIAVRGATALLRAEFEWRSRDDAPPLRIAATRAAATAPFVMRVPTGSYRMTMRDVAGGVWRVHSLLPVQHEVDVPVDGVATTVEAEFGGTIQLDVLDANGMRVDGRFTLSDAAGHDVTASMLAHDTDGRGSGVRVGAPGELHATGPNLLATPLPAGDYTLTIDPRGHRRVVRRVTVAAHAGATVKVLLD